jgi:hypothetical protein
LFILAQFRLIQLVLQSRKMARNAEHMASPFKLPLSTSRRFVLSQSSQIARLGLAVTLPFPDSVTSVHHWPCHMAANRGRFETA